MLLCSLGTRINQTSLSRNRRLYFGAGSAPGNLLGTETSGLAIDFTAPSNRLLIRTSDGKANYLGNAFTNDGGPIAFSRASNATVVDADGKVKWAAHNLLLASEQCDNANWTKTRSTITANAIAAPNGTTTADKIVEDATASNDHRVQQLVAILGSVTAGCWFKAAERTWAYIRFYDASTTKYAFFNLSTGVVGTVTSGLVASIADAGNGWYYCSAVFASPSATSNGVFVAAPASADNTPTYNGDVTKGVYFWGAHLYRSDLGGMVANMSPYPMYNPTTAKNLLGYTETFATGWTATNATSAASTEPNPNGIAVCRELTATAGNGTLLGSLSLLATPYTFSVWLKRKTGSGNIDITVDGTTYVTVAVTSSWTRFSTTLTPSAGTKTPGVRVVTNGDAVYVFGAQLSDSASLDPYVPNHFAAPSAAAYYGPRLDYDPVTLAPRGLLVEEQRSNLLTYSNDFTNSAWAYATRYSDTVATTQTAPSGQTNAQKLREDTSGSAHRIIQSVSLADSTTYIASFYAKAAERSQCVIQCRDKANNIVSAIYDLAAGTATGGSITAVGNGWYRITFSFASSTGAANPYVALILYNGGTGAYTGDGTSGLFVYGAQLETGSFATSYIPTTSASVTRSADVAQIGTAAFPYSATEGALVLSASFLGAQDNVFLAMLSDETSNNYTGLRRFSDNKLYTAMVTGGSVQWDQVLATVVSTGSTFKHGIAFSVNDGAQTINGGAVSTDTAMSIPSVNKLNIGCRYDGGSSWNGHIRQLTYLPRRIADAELQARTA